MLFFKCVQKLQFCISYLFLGIRCEVDVIIRTSTLKGFGDLSLFIEQWFEFIYEIILTRFMIYFLEDFLDS